MRHTSTINNLITVSLIFSFINLNINCVRYKTVTLPQNQPIKYDITKEYYLYKDEYVWRMNNIVLNKSHISCKLVLVTKVQPKKKQIVKLYLSGKYAATNFGNTSDLKTVNIKKAIIPFSAIDRVEVYDVDIARTILYTTSGIVGSLGLLILFILLTKTSCPFVYAYNGEAYEFTGEIYSGAIHPPLERHDYLSLPTLVPFNDEFSIKITNEVKEIQHTNLAELFVFDHPEGSEVLVDKYGNVHTINDPQTPNKAITIRGEDVEDAIIVKDGVSYMSGIPDEYDGPMDEVILTFDHPVGVEKGKLLFRGKNTFWLDYIHGEFSDLFGNQLDEWNEKQKSRSSEELMQWSLTQGIPLSVYLETDAGWEFVDYFNIVGPLASKDDILEIDLSQVTSNEVRIKLEYGFLFWEIDYAAMDFTPNSAVRQTRLPATAAINQNGHDVSDLLLHDDDLYYHQPNIGDELLLKFVVPRKEEGTVRTAILHSKGHYEILRDPTGVPDLVYLSSFKKPGAFSQFSREQFLELYNSIQD